MRNTSNSHANRSQLKHLMRKSEPRQHSSASYPSVQLNYLNRCTQLSHAELVQQVILESRNIYLFSQNFTNVVGFPCIFRTRSHRMTWRSVQSIRLANPSTSLCFHVASFWNAFSKTTLFCSRFTLVFLMPNLKPRGLKQYLYAICDRN